MNNSNDQKRNVQGKFFVYSCLHINAGKSIKDKEKKELVHLIHTSVSLKRGNS